MTSTPTLPVVHLGEAVTFYRAAGFGVRVYDATGEAVGAEGFAFVDVDGQSVFDLDGVPGMNPTGNHAGCYLISEDTELWYEQLRETGFDVTQLADQPWGMREFTLTDPSGNHVRIGRGIPDGD